MMLSNLRGGMMGGNWGNGYDMMYSFGGIHFLLGLVTWVLVIALLVALVRYLWKLGDKK